MSKLNNPPKEQAECRYCRQLVLKGPYKSTGQALIAHWWDAHREEMKLQSAKGGRASAEKKVKKGKAKPNEDIKVQEPAPGTPEDPPPEREIAPPTDPKPKQEGKIAVQKTSNITEASFFSVIPKSYQFISMLAVQAKYICEHEWGWPVMEFGEWLDNYIFHTMQQRGVMMGAYRIMSPEEMKKMFSDNGQEGKIGITKSA